MMLKLLLLLLLLLLSLTIFPLLLLLLLPFACPHSSRGGRSARVGTMKEVWVCGCCTPMRIRFLLNGEGLGKVALGDCA